MNYIKIEGNSVHFRLKEEDEWKAISEIQGMDILALLKASIENDEFQIDEYKDELIRNEAHNIIYKSIYEKINEIIINKENILDENSQRYKDIIEEYKD